MWVCARCHVLSLCSNASAKSRMCSLARCLYAIYMISRGMKKLKPIEKQTTTLNFKNQKIGFPAMHSSFSRIVTHKKVARHEPLNPSGERALFDTLW